MDRIVHLKTDTKLFYLRYAGLFIRVFNFNNTSYVIKKDLLAILNLPTQSARINKLVTQLVHFDLETELGPRGRQVPCINFLDLEHIFAAINTRESAHIKSWFEKTVIPYLETNGLPPNPDIEELNPESYEPGFNHFRRTQELIGSEVRKAIRRGLYQVSPQYSILHDENRTTRVLHKLGNNYYKDLLSDKIFIIQEVSNGKTLNP